MHRQSHPRLYAMLNAAMRFTGRSPWELSRRFQQKHGVPVAVVIESVAASGAISNSRDLPGVASKYIPKTLTCHAQE